LFTGIALLVFSRYLTSWRDKAAMKVVLGAAVPLFAALLYFYSIRALADLWTWTVAYNLKVYAPETARGVGQTAALLWKVAVRVFRWDLALVVLGAVGLITFAAERVRARIKDGPFEASEAFRDAIVLAPSIYLAFCLINFQSGPDLLPLFPFIGMFGGWLIVKVGGSPIGRELARIAPAAAVVVLLTLIVFRSMTYRVDSLTLQDQQKQFAAIAEVLSPNERIYVHGTVEILVLLNKPNLNPYIFLDRGKDEWIAKRTDGGFLAVLDEMDSASPKVVAVSRTGKVAHSAELRQWVNARYDPLDMPGYPGIYLRRQR